MEWKILSKKLDEDINKLFEENKSYSVDIIKQRVNNYRRSDK